MSHATPPHPPTPSRPPAIDLSVQMQTPDTDPPLRNWLKPKLRRVMKMLPLTAGRLAMLIVDDPAMIQLHQRYRQDASTTDVLTFDLRDSPDQPLDADIVICLDEAARQARRRGHDTRVEVLLYAVHGLLHLLGENDHEQAAYDHMHRREDQLLTAIGVGPVFTRPRGD